jgi:hypothetical protein
VVESECRKWIEIHVLDGINQTLAKGIAFNYEGINQDEIENV